MQRSALPQLTSRQRQLALGVIMAIALLLCLLQTPSLAQSSGLEARVNRLESANSSLRARIGQLESQIGRVGRSAAAAPTAPAAPAANTTGLAEDPTFRRLATLVVELRDRIAALEGQASDRIPVLQPSSPSPFSQKGRRGDGFKVPLPLWERDLG